MLETEVRGPITRVHVWRTMWGRSFYTASAYLVDGLLVDTGPPATAREVVAWARGQEVHQVVNSHHHEDHSGGDGPLQRALGVPVAAHHAAVPILAAFPRLPLYRRLVWGQPRNVVAEPLGAAVETARYRFEVIPTPGHTPDHVCFFEPREGWLFGGDLFVHERVRYLRAGEDAGAILASLRGVLALRPRLLLCAHAGFVSEPCAAIERKIAYWEGLAEAARRWQAEGLSLRETTERVLGPEDVTARASRGQFSKLNLIRSLLEANENRPRIDTNGHEPQA
ncbi:MAG: MBL fold metallo-hydrolase [Anaerolineae bacterium]|nr:MBL fold metallo-hydrolase [Anaerolineae bacterium]